MTTQTLINEFFENTTSNVFTVRITPKHLSTQDCPEADIIITDHTGIKPYLESVLTTLVEKLDIYTYILAREKSKRGIEHFHLRFTTDKSLSVVRKWRSFFVDDELKGQKYYVLHKCRVNGVVYDDKLWKSATYICKDGDIVASHGYTVSQIQDLIAYGNQLKLNKNLPLWRRIISRSRLQESSLDSEILNAVIDLYESLDKPIPNWSHLKSTIHNIKYTLQKHYREQIRNKFESEMNKLSEISRY